MQEFLKYINIKNESSMGQLILMFAVGLRASGINRINRGRFE